MPAKTSPAGDCGRAFRWQAYCEECQDGINTKSAVYARTWATKHNEKEH